MFESDDFDQVLSQFEFPEDVTVTKTFDDKKERAKSTFLNLPSQIVIQNGDDRNSQNVKAVSPTVLLNNNKDIIKDIQNVNTKSTEIMSPKHTKRKIIGSYFDHKSKRKFPGPAGLLTGGFEENKDETICQMELLSQDVDFSQNNLRGDLFESPVWTRLLDDLKNWNLNEVDSIKSIKQRVLTGNLRRKAHVVAAFVETVDRSVTDPLIIMRDITGSIKGTLHRDAWTAFSQYIAAEYCALILWKPTILTTGSAFKKHYLNITLSNILAVYSSTILSDDTDNRILPDGYVFVSEDEFTVIKSENYSQNIGSNFTFNSEGANGANDLLDGLDGMFSEEIF